MPDAAPTQLQCMEVWGGNAPTDTAVGLPGLDVWVFAKPFGGAEAGGDVHYISSCATGRIARWLLADVSGHGESVAAIAGKLRDLMRRNINYLSQTRLVGQLNEQFAESKLGNKFATAVAATYFAPTGDLSLCNAGHPPPLIYRADNQTWSFLERTETPRDESAAVSNIPLGILMMTGYEQFDTRLGTGDVLICYTDALIESHDADGNLLGQAGLLRIARTLEHGDADRMTHDLLEAVRAVHDGNLTDDDVSVVTMRVVNASSTPPLRQRLLAPWLTMKQVWRAWRSGDGTAPWPEFNLANLAGILVSPLNRAWSKRIKPGVRDRREPQMNTDEHR